MRNPTLLGRLAIMAVLAIGITPLWFYLAATIYGTVAGSDKSRGILMFQDDGTPLLQYYEAGNLAARTEDLAGKVVELPEQSPRLNTVYLKWFDEQGELDGSDDWMDRLAVYSDARNQPTFWYFISDGRPQGHAYLVGYNTINKLRVGYIGKHGFRTDQPSREDCFPFRGGSEGIKRYVVSQQTNRGGVFPGNVYNNVQSTKPNTASKSFDVANLFIQGTDRLLYNVNLRQRTVNTVPNVTKVESSSLSYWVPDQTNMLFVRSESEVLLLDETLQIKRRYQIPTDAAGYAFDWVEIEPGKAIAYWEDSRHVPLDMKSTKILWFDAAGQVSRRETVNSPGSGLDWADWPTLAVGLPSPLLDAGILGILFPRDIIRQQRADNWQQAWAMSWEMHRSDMALSLAIAALLAGACYRREMLYAAPSYERIIWTLLILIGGLPVWFGYRFGRRWPVLERCPRCSSQVPRDRVECSHCQVDFPSPELRGTEILAC